MFFAFAKRRWAKRVIKKMEPPVGSQPAAILLAMIMEGTKHFEDMAARSPGGKKMTAAEYVLLSTGAMTRNPNSILRIADEGKMSTDQAIGVLQQAKRAGRELAQAEQCAPIVLRVFDGP